MKRRTLLTLVICCSWSNAGWAQEPQSPAPWLNAFGRFWGIGYSAGYHAQNNSRLGFHHYSPDHNVVPQPPRGLHGNPNLYAGPAVHGYGQGSMIHMPMSAPIPSSAPFSNPSSAPGMQSQNLVPPPPKPVDPPPNWLKQYIKPDGEPDKAGGNELLNENSPSDRRGVMLSPSPDDSTTSITITPAQPTVQIGGRPVISILQQ